MGSRNYRSKYSPEWIAYRDEPGKRPVEETSVYLPPAFNNTESKIMHGSAPLTCKRTFCNLVIHEDIPAHLAPRCVALGAVVLSSANLQTAAGEAKATVDVF